MIKKLVLIIVLLVTVLTACQQSVWKDFNSEESGFSVSMPGMPTEKILVANLSAGEMDFKTYNADYSGQLFSVAFIKYSKPAGSSDNPDARLDKTRDVIIDRLKGNLLSEKRIPLAQYMGREIIYEIPSSGQIISHRMYLVNQYAYQLTVTSSKGKIIQDDITKFFESFRLLSK